MGDTTEGFPIDIKVKCDSKEVVKYEAISLSSDTEEEEVESTGSDILIQESNTGVKEDVKMVLSEPAEEVEYFFVEETSEEYAGQSQRPQDQAAQQISEATCVSYTCCQFCYKGTDATEAVWSSATPLRQAIEFVLAVELENDDPQCCNWCLTNFQTFFDFKRSCLTSLRKIEQMGSLPTSQTVTQKKPVSPQKHKRKRVVARQRAKRYICPKCSKGFSVESFLIKHKLSCIDGLDTDILQCPKCPVIYRHPTRLQYHINAHNGIKPYKCKATNCDKRFVNPDGRTSHHRKCFKFIQNSCCEICGKFFNDPLHLQGHIEIMHRELLVHICDRCNKGFSQRSDLQSHVENSCSDISARKQQSTESRERAKKIYDLGQNKDTEYHWCEGCKRKFLTEDTLNRHKLSCHQSISISSDHRPSSKDTSEYEQQLEKKTGDQTCIRRQNRVEQIGPVRKKPQLQCSVCGLRMPFEAAKELKAHMLEHKTSTG